MFLKIFPTKAAVRFGVRGKLNLRYVGPFEVLVQIGKMVYRLALPLNLAGVCNVFHISQLRKCTPNLDHIIELEQLEIYHNLTKTKFPVKTVNTKEQ